MEFFERPQMWENCVEQKPFYNKQFKTIESKICGNTFNKLFAKCKNNPAPSLPVQQEHLKSSGKM